MSRPSNRARKPITGFEPGMIARCLAADASADRHRLLLRA
jgi:hypothetical protein